MKFSMLFLLLWLVFSHSNAEEAVMAIIPLHNRSAAEMIALLTPMLENTDRIIADNQNGLIVKTTSYRMASIQNLVHTLDTPATNLAITVLQDTTKTAAELNNTISSAAGLQMHGLNANTNDLSNRQSLQVLKTTSGYPAYIKIGQTRPVPTLNNFGYIGNQQLLETNTQVLEASSGFAVTPQLTGNQVTLTIAPWSEHFQSGNHIASQTSDTQIRINLGVWVEIAGNNSIQSDSINYGINSYNHEIRKNISRILIKVDKVN